MGLISGIKDALYAGKVVRIVAEKLGVNPYQLPAYVREYLLSKGGNAYRVGGMSPEEAAESIVQQMGWQIRQDMKSGQ